MIFSYRGYPWSASKVNPVHIREPACLLHLLVKVWQYMPIDRQISFLGEISHFLDAKSHLIWMPVHNHFSILRFRVLMHVHASLPELWFCPRTLIRRHANYAKTAALKSSAAICKLSMRPECARTADHAAQQERRNVRPAITSTSVAPDAADDPLWPKRLASLEKRLVTHVTCCSSLICLAY